MKYTVDYFIKKFEAIPEKNWCEFARHDINGRHCAHGWCDLNNEGAIGTQEEKGLCKIARYLKLDGLARINNGCHENYKQPTPKQRILAALYDIKKLQEPKYPDITKELAKFEIGDKTDLMPNEQEPERSVATKINSEQNAGSIKVLIK